MFTAGLVCRCNMVEIKEFVYGGEFGYKRNRGQMGDRIILGHVIFLVMFGWFIYLG